MDGFQTDRPRPHFLIADDHAIFAESLRLYLEKKYTVVGLVNNGRQPGRGGPQTSARRRLSSMLACHS